MGRTLISKEGANPNMPGDLTLIFQKFWPTLHFPSTRGLLQEVLSYRGFFLFWGSRGEGFRVNCSIKVCGIVIRDMDPNPNPNPNPYPNPNPTLTLRPNPNPYPNPYVSVE